MKETPTRAEPNASGSDLPPTPPFTPFTCHERPSQSSEPQRKRRKLLKSKIDTSVVWNNIQDVCAKFRQPLSSVLGQRVLQKDAKGREALTKVVETVVEARGVKRGVHEVLGNEVHQQLLQSLRVSDWVLLYFKLQARIPDHAWQTLLNLSTLGRTGVSGSSFYHLIYLCLFCIDCVNVSI